MHLSSAGEFHNSMPAQLSLSSWLGCQHFFLWSIIASMIIIFSSVSFFLKLSFCPFSFSHFSFTPFLLYPFNFTVSFHWISLLLSFLSKSLTTMKFLTKWKFFQRNPNSEACFDHQRVESKSKNWMKSVWKETSKELLFSLIFTESRKAVISLFWHKGY